MPKCRPGPRMPELRVTSVNLPPPRLETGPPARVVPPPGTPAAKVRAGPRDAGPRGHVGNLAPPQVRKEAMPPPAGLPALDQEQVVPAVVVVIDDGAAGARGLHDG